MRSAAFAILAFTVMACNSNNADTALVKGSENSTSAAPAKKAAVVIPVVKIGVEGFYTGPFNAVRYAENKDYFDNKITICIDSLDAANLYGRSVVAGIERPFKGPYEKKANTYIVTAKEPGDNQYDGVFQFTLDTKEKTVKGSWKANNKNITVTERSYDLATRSYKYDPQLELPEDVVGMMLHGTYNDRTEQAETVTEDAIMKNASVVLLKSKDVENMFKADLEVMRNAIYARHGYSFKNLRMRLLFDNYVEWYMPVSTDVSSVLTDIEKKNIDLIKRYEKHATKYYDVFGR